MEDPTANNDNLVRDENWRPHNSIFYFDLFTGEPPLTDEELRTLQTAADEWTKTISSPCTIKRSDAGFEAHVGHFCREAFGIGMDLFMHLCRGAFSEIHRGMLIRAEIGNADEHPPSEDDPFSSAEQYELFGSPEQ